MPIEKLTRERRRELTRNALLDAARHVFAQRGFSGASLEEIAETAGFTRGAIYKNFANEDAQPYEMLLQMIVPAMVEPPDDPPTSSTPT